MKNVVVYLIFFVQKGESGLEKQESPRYLPPNRICKAQALLLNGFPANRQKKWEAGRKRFASCYRSLVRRRCYRYDLLRSMLLVSLLNNMGVSFSVK